MRDAPAAKDIAAKTLTALKRVARHKAPQLSRAYFREPVAVIGVSAPQMRTIAREIHAEIKKSWGLAEAVSLCDLMLTDQSLEPRGTSLLILERFHRLFDASLFRDCDRWLDAGYCDSWAMVDTLCMCVVSPLLKKEPSLIAKVTKWTKSRNQWFRRAAAAALVPLARHGEALDDAYKIAKRLLGDEEDLVRKATGWLLREAGKTDSGRLEMFLREHGSRCSRVTLRYAIERFPNEVRKRILEETR